MGGQGLWPDSGWVGEILQEASARDATGPLRTKSCAPGTRISKSSLGTGSLQGTSPVAAQKELASSCCFFCKGCGVECRSFP